MFERFREKARRCVFFARYEASEFGSPFIETHHLLLGVLREQPDLIEPTITPSALEKVRTDLLTRFPPQGHVPKSIDLPLSDECGRVLAYAVEEAERLGRKDIDSGHLMIGMLREEKSVAAEMLRGLGLSLEPLRTRMLRDVPDPQHDFLQAMVGQVPVFRRDAAARILEALQWDIVKIAVTSPKGNFEISFEGSAHSGT